YACGAVVVPACAVDAPHRRDRLWFVAHTDDAGPQGLAGHVVRTAQGRSEPAGPAAEAGVLDRAEQPGGAVADASGRRLRGPREGEVEQPRRAEAVGSGHCGTVADADLTCT